MFLPIVLATLAAAVPPMPCDSGATPLPADLERSGIKWKGTKFWGLGSHEGTVALRRGVLCVRNGRIVGGEFVADMTSIEVTDIPADDPVPRRRLRDHLLSEDFFYATAFPEARISLKSVERMQQSLHQVAATLTIRGITHDVVFYARIWSLDPERVSAEARFAVDRHRWGVRYRGSTIRDDLVDDEFWLDLTLHARRAQAESATR
jgi:polyisoprenoid-binding protein YceI